MYSRKNKSKILQREKGITLIALVVTMIVLLILAGVTIAILTGDNGILSKAQESKNKTEQANVDELKKLTQLEATTHFEDYEYRDNSTDTEKTITIPANCAVSRVEGENTLKDGLVIIDKNGNEWVWIEVPKNEKIYINAGLDIIHFTSDELNTIYNDLRTYTKEYDIGAKDIYYDGCGISIESYNRLKNAMIKSIYINEGFWIGRYEVGVENFRTDINNDEHKPVVKKGYYPYNFITCSKAQQLASSLSLDTRTSSLLFGIQWDLAIKYLDAKGIKEQSEIQINSSSWGNFKESSFQVLEGKYSIATNTPVLWTNITENYKKEAGSVILFLTGATERNKILNIYDLAGNVCEWTLEKSEYTITNPCMRRGGSVANQNYSVLGRGGSSIDGGDVFVGFRATLY